MKFILLLSFFYRVHVLQIQYLNGLFEDDVCEYENGINGTCTQITDCTSEFEKYKRDEKVLKICSYGDVASKDIICCPHIKLSQKVDLIKSRKNDVTKFETCRDAFLKYRKNGTNIDHYVHAYNQKKIPKTLENCKKVNDFNKMSNNHGSNFWSPWTYECRIGKADNFSICQNLNYFGFLMRKGDRPNMAAIGWTLRDNSVLFNCGGSIITERFIVTAAHCKFYEKKIADTVRVGDRFLVTKDDDEVAQQLRVKNFITHPNYTFSISYNDIALIQTVESIIFNEFVVPSCIADLDAEVKGTDPFWTVAGYGNTEDGSKTNILMELNTFVLPNSECNEILTDYPELPNGIIDSQICVANLFNPPNSIGEHPNICFGDSGSPLQYNTAYEVFPDDFNETFLSNVYQSSNAVGIMSFGVSCSLDVPTVYTKLSYFREWISLVTESS